MYVFFINTWLVTHLQLLYLKNIYVRCNKVLIREKRYVSNVFSIFTESLSNEILRNKKC